MICEGERRQGGIVIVRLLCLTYEEERKEMLKREGVSRWQVEGTAVG
jgi:hypothetical protein